MEDLELELGSSAVGFMHIRVSYSHSAFPEQAAAEPDVAGVSGLRSRMETTATASLMKQHDAFSMWSPRPEPLQSHILPLVQRHWGTEKAMSMKRLIMGQQHPQPRRLPRTRQGQSGEPGLLGLDSAAARAPPARAITRQASLRTGHTPEASTFGAAAEGRAQQLLSPAPPTAPPSLSSSRSSDEGHCYGGPLDQRNSGDDGRGNVGILQGRAETRSGSGTSLRSPLEAWAATGPEEGRRTRQDQEALHGKSMQDTGFWNWGLWF